MNPTKTSGLIIRLTIFISLTSLCCGRNYMFMGWDGRLKVINNSTKPIYAGYSESFPDTSIILFNDSNLLPDKQGSGSNIVYIHKLGSWDVYFKKKDAEFKLFVFIFDANVIEAKKWEEIVGSNLYLKRYEFSYEELKKINWQINYP